MVVELDDSAVTLNHEGNVYGYCSTYCRATHAQELGVGAAA